MNAIPKNNISHEPERILLVDDEKRLLPVLKLMIESLGLSGNRNDRHPGGP